MSFAGLRGTGDWGADERPKDFREMILRLNPNGKAPLFALSAQSGRQAVEDPEFNWWEEEMYVPRLRVSVGLASNAGSTAVEFNRIDGVDGSKGNGLDLRAGDLLLVELTPSGAATPVNEIVRVSSVTDASNIVVQRAYGGTTLAAVAADSFLYRVGNAFEEGSGSPEVSSRNPTKLYNYTQIFKTAVEVSETAKSTTARTGDPLEQERIRKAFEHSASIEQAMLWGERSETTGSGGKPIRTTRGIYRYLSTNITAWNNAAFTQSNMLTFISQLFNNTADGIPNQRVALCGQAFINKFNEVIATASNTQFQFMGTLKLYGMELMRYAVPNGQIAFKTHPLFTQNALYTGSCLMYAPGAVYVRPLKGRDTKLMKNIQANDQDSEKDQWLSEVGLELEHESLHGWAHYNDA